MDTLFSRRSWLHATGLASLLAAAGTLAGSARLRGVGAPAAHEGHGAPPRGHGHGLGTVGRVSTTVFDPAVFLRTWNFSELPLADRARVYHETPRPDGTLLREYNIFAVDREIEIAPGVFYPAWTYNGQVPGPTIRATEGDRVKV